MGIQHPTQENQELAGFPGIQVADEPPVELLQEISNREKWPHGTELLGLYSGIVRTKQSFAQLKYAPDLIFVFVAPFCGLQKEICETK